MAGVSGTEVLYKRESKLGLTTLTFRKRRYMSPNVIVKGDPSMSASTGNLESGGMCALLDVGLYCPHCAGAITAQLSGSHSKLLITKGDGEHQCTSAIQLEESPQLEYYSTTDAPGSTTEATTVSSTEASNIRTTKHAQIIKIHTERDTTEDTSNMLESFVEQSPKETLDTFSSSDYESLDRDSCVTSMNSHHNSTDTCVSVASCTGGITSPRADEAYCSLASSYHSTTPEPSGESPQRVLSRMSPQSSKYSSLPHDVGLSSNGYSSSEERLVLDSMHVDLSDTNDEVLVDELLSDEVIDEEYHSLMSGSVTKSLTSHEGSNQELYGDNPRHGLLSEDSFDVSRSEDNISDRSASPELFVDDVLENMESEIISGEATLPRVFALQKSGITRKRQRHRQMHEQSSVDSVEWDTPSRKPKPGEIIIEGSASLQRRKIRDMVKHKYKNVQKSIKFSAQQKTDFTHENFFEDVLEALTDLEGGFTDWAENDSDNHDTARSALDSSSARFMLCENDDDEYKDSLDVYNISRKTATSSCECIADDRSRELDSSSEHIAFTAETASEASTLEGYDSSSECSYSGLVGPMHDDAGLFEQLIQETQILTDDLMIKYANASATKSANLEPCVGLVRPDRRVSPIRDQCDIIDEVHLEESPQHFDVDLVDTARLEYQKVSKKPNIHADVIRPALPIPTIIEPCDDSESYVHMTSTPKNPHKQFFSGNTSDEDDIDSSLENLLTCNAIHCSTSDLDEPFSNELNHMSHVGDENPSDTSHEVSGESNISQDFQKCLNTDTTEVDEFVPEMGSDKIKTETLQESTQYVMSQHVSDHTSKIVSKESKNQTERNDIVQENTSKNDSFKNAVKCGQWDSFVNESDTKVATFESKDNTTKNQDQEFMKYVLSKSSQTQHSKEHNTDLDACLDQVCQTCDFKPNTPDEIVKNEEVITKEVTLVFAWPKKMKIPKQLTPGMPPTKSSQPFRTIHLRRVMRVTDVDMEVIEGPTIETVQYERDGSTTKSISVQGSPQKALLQADKQLEQQDLGKQQATSLKAANSSECTKMTHIISDSDRTRLTEESSDIVEEELSHYNTTSDAFIMPELDMHNTQQSELLFDMSSSISMEYLTDMENKVDVVYEDHQKAMEQIYEQATYDMDSDNGKNMDFNGIDTTDDATTRKPPDESSTIEDLEYMPYMSDQSVHDDGDVVETDRQSENAPGKDPEAKFIEQNERNVLLLDTGKYFTPHPRDPDLNIDRVVYVNNRNSQDVHVMETVCPRCSDIYIFDDEQNMIRTSQNDLMEEKLLTRLQHPVPCARCIRLEREIKIKLEELSVMVEKIGRQKSLSDDKGTSMTDSIDDLQNLSQETVENIHTLQQSISSIQHVRKGDTPHVPGTDSLTSKQTHQITPEVQQNVKDIKYSLPSDNGHAMVSITPTTDDIQAESGYAPVNYSTKVIKKKKKKHRHVPKLDEVFRSDAQYDVEMLGNIHDTNNNPNGSADIYLSPIIANSSVDEEQCVGDKGVRSDISQQLDTAAIEQDAMDTSESTHHVDTELLKNTSHHKHQISCHSDVCHEEQNDNNDILDDIVASKNSPDINDAHNFPVTAQATLDDNEAVLTSNACESDMYNTDIPEILEIQTMSSSITDNETDAKPPQLPHAQHLDTFADNMAKYILFRSKLAIVLENPATRIHCLRNEQIGEVHSCPKNDNTTCTKSPTKGSCGHTTQTEIIYNGR